MLFVESGHDIMLNLLLIDKFLQSDIFDSNIAESYSTYSHLTISHLTMRPDSAMETIILLVIQQTCWGHILIPNVTCNSFVDKS